VDHIPLLDRGHERGSFSARQTQADHAWTPERTGEFVAAVALQAVDHLLACLRIVLEPGIIADEREPQRRILVLLADFDVRAVDRDCAAGRVLVQQPLVRAEVDRRAQVQRRAAAIDQFVNDVGRVLPVRHDHALLEAHAASGVAPDRHAAFEDELVELQLGVLDPFLEMVEHHRPAQRRRQRGDELAVKAAGARAADGAAGVAAESVGDEPFAGGEFVRGVTAAPSDLHRIHRARGVRNPCLTGPGTFSAPRRASRRA
jgi:hypothetical protein